VRLPPEAAGRTLAPVAVSAGQWFEIDLLVDGRAEHLWSHAGGEGCIHLDPYPVPASAQPIELMLRGSGWALDRLDLSEKPFEKR
jgi:hypothetical protein